MPFSMTFKNTFNDGAITVDNSSSYNDWRIPSDGLDGFGSLPFSTSQAELSVTQGGFILGAHSGIRQLTVKLEAPPTATKRDEAYKVFAIGSPITVTASYLNDSSRTIDGTVTGCEVNEGNIYEPTTVTATIDCYYPIFREQQPIEQVASSYSADTSTATWRWQFDINGDSLADIKRALVWFTTGNTKTVTLTKKTVLSLTVRRYPSFEAYALPDETVISWNMGDAAGSTLSADTYIACGVEWLDGVPNGTWNGDTQYYTVNYANLAKCKGVSSDKLAGGTTCSVTIKLEMDSQIMPKGTLVKQGSFDYRSGWQGI